MIKSAVSAAIEKEQEARRRRLARKINHGAVSVSGILWVFRERMRELDYGEPPLVTVRDRDRLLGFIALCRKNGKESSWVYDQISKLVEYWPVLRKYEHTSIHGKAWILGERPTLRDFLLCRDSMISAIAKIEMQRKSGLE